MNRFAPSPTGKMHIGNLRTAIFSWLISVQNKQDFFIRIDDTDTERNNIDNMKEILFVLNLFGIQYKRMIMQSARLNIYNRYAKALCDAGYAIRENGAIVINPHSLIDSISFDDSIFGRIQVKTSDIEKLVIVRSNGWPTYNFASVVDDIVENVQWIVRGADHISNTSKQLCIADLISRIDESVSKWKPKFVHLPLILNEKREKISKRSGNIDIIDLLRQGYTISGIINCVMRLGWSSGNIEYLTMNDALSIFDQNKINRANAIFSLRALNNYTRYHIRNMSSEQVYFDYNLYCMLNKKSVVDYILFNELWDLIRTRTSNISQIHELVNIFTRDKIEYSNPDLTLPIVEIGNDICKMLKLKQYEDDNRPKISGAIESIYGRSIALSTIRYILTGCKDGFDTTYLFRLISVEHINARILNCLDYIERSQLFC